MALDPLASTDDLATLLRRTFSAAEEAAAQLILVNVSASIRTYTGQTLSLVEDDELATWADWTYQLWLPERPVTELTSITVNGTLIAASTYDWDQSGEVRFVPGMIPGGSVPWARSRATIVYSHGWDPMRDDIKGVCLDMAKGAVLVPDSAGVTEEQIGNYSVKFDSAAAGRLTADHERQLRGYRLPVTSAPITVGTW